jgi:hypothetical protein
MDVATQTRVPLENSPSHSMPAMRSAIADLPQPSIFKKAPNKIVIILSSKSSGSSAMQHYLTVNYGAHFIGHSQHFENESLFWTKAASVLELPQQPMYHSEVPIPQSLALQALDDLLRKNNIASSVDRHTSKEEFFELFYKLCKQAGFPVVEKSPHHLFNISNVHLILEFKKYIAPRADVVLIGLVRNPIDTVYSAWTRWRFSHQAFEQEWFYTYRNLHKLPKLTTDIKIFRYEDISRSSLEFDEFLFSRCGLKKISNAFSFNENSLYKWKRDGFFHYHLSRAAKILALSLGYNADDLTIKKTVSIWWTIREVLHGVWIRWKNYRKSYELPRNFGS